MPIPKYGCEYIPDESKETEIIEVEVKAYKRKVTRHRMKKNCSCDGVPNTVTAKRPPTPIKNSPYGVSIWENVLLNKYRSSQPTNRLVKELTELGLPISPGTIAGGLKNLMKLFLPIYQLLCLYQIEKEELFFKDETLWKVFELIEDKINNRWWLWVSRCEI